MRRQRAVIYTAIFGGYEELKPPVPQDEECDFICFTDGNLPSRVGAWHVVRVRRGGDIHPRLRAKYFKVLSHRVFSKGRLALRYAPFSVRRRSDLSIWIDGSLRIKSPTLVTDMRSIVDDSQWAMFSHPWRDCIYEEAAVSMGLPKYYGLPVDRQVEAYRSVVPAHGGLYACGVIVRREPSTERLNRLHELWWRENIKWTYQDQLSLPYVLRELRDCEPRRIPGDVMSNGWFDFVPHGNDR
jgi:hypothetical protein